MQLVSVLKTVEMGLTWERTTVMIKTLRVVMGVITAAIRNLGGLVVLEILHILIIALRCVVMEELLKHCHQLVTCVMMETTIMEMDVMQIAFLNMVLNVLVVIYTHLMNVQKSVVMAIILVFYGVMMLIQKGKYINWLLTEFSGDGCSSTCEIEDGWKCAGGGYYFEDTCTEICGDGLDFDQYFCDDGNLIAGDGCNSVCNIETGYTCTGGSPTGPDHCWRPHPRIVNATLSKNNTVITLTFNETTFLKSTFTKDDILVYVSGPRDVYSYYIDVLNLNYYRGRSSGFTTLEV